MRYNLDLRNSTKLSHISFIYLSSMDFGVFINPTFFLLYIVLKSSLLLTQLKLENLHKLTL